MPTERREVLLPAGILEIVTENGLNFMALSLGTLLCYSAAQFLSSGKGQGILVIVLSLTGLNKLLMPFLVLYVS
jgi:hypothetical protein